MNNNTQFDSKNKLEVFFIVDSNKLEVNSCKPFKNAKRSLFTAISSREKSNIIWLLSLVSAFFVILSLILLLILVFHERQPGITSQHFDQEINRSGIVPRRHWVAQPPNNPLDPLKLPVPYVIIHHTATENCSTAPSCVFHVRTIQSFHVDSQGWSDIGYNFLVGGDGFVYEGRGWTSMGSHLKGYNDKSIGIAFIGTFINIRPTEKQTAAVLKLIERGVKNCYIDSNYKLLGARQLKDTISPGDALYSVIQTWSHWTDKP